MRKSRDIKLLLEIFFAIVVLIILFVLSFLHYYNVNTNFFSNFKLVNRSSSEIFIQTPINKKIKIESTFDTIAIRQRPIKSIHVIQDDKYIELSSYESLNAFLEQNNQIEIIMQDTSKSFIGLIGWGFRSHPILKKLLFGICFLIFIVFIKMMHMKIYFWCKSVYSKIKRRMYRVLLNVNHPKIEIEPIELTSFNKFLLLSLCIVLIPILYTHLDRPYSYSEEEKKRALVALEMKIQDNYIEPTLAGERYTNKPPVFNWFLVPFIKMKKVEAATRAVSVSFLIISAFMVFFLIKKDTNWYHALLTAFLYLSSAYVLIYFSLVLYIDSFFAILLIVMLYLNFRLISREKYLLAFILTYLLSAVAVLTKGFYVLWFAQVSIISALWLHGKLKVIFSFRHIVGILPFISVIGLYFYLYSGDYNVFVKNLIRQSMKGDISYFNKTVFHVLTFIGKNSLLYLPIGILAPLLIFRTNIVAIIKNKRLSYLLINVVFGIAVFLTSFEYSQYYILIYVPLIIELILYLIKPFSLSTKRESFYFVLFNIIIIAPICLYFLLNLQNILVNILIIVAVLNIFLMIIFKKQIITVLLLSSLLFMGIRLFQNKLPDSVVNDQKAFMLNTKLVCKEMTNKYSKANFYIYATTTPINSAPIFYLSYYSNNLISYYDKCNDFENALLIVNKDGLLTNQVILDSIPQMSVVNNKWVYDPLYIINFDKSDLETYNKTKHIRFLM